MPVSKQLPDGRWVSAAPMGWQPGIYGISGANWEAARRGDRWVAELLVKRDLITTVTAKTKLGLSVRMHIAQRRHLHRSS